MINKISRLEYLGKFSSLTQEKDFQYGNQNCNIVFGFNGSGKTTISNAISFFAANSCISEDEKTAIFNDIKDEDSAIVELDLQDGNKCKYPNNKHNKNIYVFNPNFVVTHVFDGTKGRLKKFSNVSAGIETEAIKQINTTITDLETEKEKLEKEQAIFDVKLKAINQVNSSSFNKTLTDKGKRLTAPNLSNGTLPSESITVLQQKLTKLAADYDLSKRQQDLAVDLQVFGRIVFKQHDLDLDGMNSLLNKNIQQLSKEALENKIKEVKASFADESYKQSVEKWFRFGKSILDSAKEHGGQTKCPICDTDISARLDEVLKNFNGYFDKSYEDFITELKIRREHVQATISLISQCETDATNLRVLWEKYKAQIAGQNFVDFDFKAVKTGLETILNACDSKLTNIQFDFKIPQVAIDSLVRANTAINGFDELKSVCMKTLSTKKLDRNTIEDEIRETYRKITLLEFDQVDKGGNFDKYNKNQKKIITISTSDPTNTNGLLFYQNKRREELKKIKAESKGLSKFLKIIGISHFTVDINENAPDENIIIKYASSTKDKNKLRNCLSEGEKTALAFSYFLSKFENECDTVNKREESIVIIDDPISSLDENRLYSTAYLIRDVFKTTKQLIVLSHNFLFLKFFNCSYGKKTNCLFINGDKLTDLPEELKNFQSPYFYMLKHIIEFSNGTAVDYQNAKKYLPNYIRRVLETFLSFKFAKLVDRPNGNHSPGLNSFDDNIDELSIEGSAKEKLKETIAKIVKITDQHSHGNAQLTEENFYISEEELKKLAKDAIEIIETMDNLHKISCNA